MRNALRNLIAAAVRAAFNLETLDRHDKAATPETRARDARANALALRQAIDQANVALLVDSSQARAFDGEARKALRSVRALLTLPSPDVASALVIVRETLRGIVTTERGHETEAARVPCACRALLVAPGGSASEGTTAHSEAQCVDQGARDRKADILARTRAQAAAETRAKRDGGQRLCWCGSQFELCETRDGRVVRCVSGHIFGKVSGFSKGGR